MSSADTHESILVVDCGSATTRAMLFDIVGGHYRFIAAGQAASTSEPPQFDISIGIQHAVAELELVTDRKFLGSNGQMLVPSQGGILGVDRFVATTSAGPPLKAVLVGLMDDVSLASAKRVALSTYVTIEDVLDLADARSEDEQIEQLVALMPDVILISGGTDGGAKERVLQLAETVAASLVLLSGQASRPVVIYAGNAELRPQIAEILKEAQWTAAENIRPHVDIEYLDSALSEMDQVYDRKRLAELSGAQELNSQTGGLLLPTAKAFGWTIQYLGQVLKRNVIGVDIGSASVTMGAVIDNRPLLTVRSDLGVGHNLPQLLEEIDPRHVLRWLPQGVTRDMLADYAANKRLFPRSIPMTSEELHIELALVRELIRHLLPMTIPARRLGSTVGVMPPVEMILASGATLANIPRPGLAALVLLDALQPVGICSLAVDLHSLAAPLGAISAAMPAAAVQVIESGAFRELGAVVAPLGQANFGDVILNLKMVYQNGSELEVEVEYGSLEVLPLPASQQAELHLNPHKHFDVGAGLGRSWSRRVYGGAVGLIVDARGRPIRLPGDLSERDARIQQWLWDMGG